MKEIKIENINELKQLMQSNEVFVEAKDSGEYIRIYLIEDKVILKFSMFGQVHNAEIKEIEEASNFYIME